MRPRKPRLDDVSFRRVLHAFQRMLDDNHRLGWWIANDLYERLRDQVIDTDGANLTNGPAPMFNKTQRHWANLIASDYPDVRKRAQLAFDLVSKARYMLRNGNLSYENHNNGRNNDSRTVH